MNERIIVVDDEREIADLLEVYLKNEGFQVETFYQGEPALAAIRRNPPALALLDVMLPDLDGFSICKKIREKHSVGNTPSRISILSSETGKKLFNHLIVPSFPAAAER